MTFKKGDVHSKKAKEKMSKSKLKEKNPRWNNGASQYQNHFILKKIRIDILKKTKGKCEICDDHAQIIHHIDYSKNNHKSENLMALCNKCHRAIHNEEGLSIYGRPFKYAYKYGMSQVEMANKIGVCPATICNWLKSPEKRDWLEKKLLVK